MEHKIVVRSEVYDVEIFKCNFMEAACTVTRALEGKTSSVSRREEETELLETTLFNGDGKSRAN